MHAFDAVSYLKKKGTYLVSDSRLLDVWQRSACRWSVTGQFSSQLKQGFGDIPPTWVPNMVLFHAHHTVCDNRYGLKSFSLIVAAGEQDSW